MRSPGNIYKSDGFKVHGVLYLEVVFDHRVEYPIGVSYRTPIQHAMSTSPIYTACYVPMSGGRYTACYVHMFRTEEASQDTTWSPSNTATCPSPRPLPDVHMFRGSHTAQTMYS